MLCRACDVFRSSEAAAVALEEMRSTPAASSLGSMRHRRIVAKHEGHVRNSIRNAAGVYGLRGTSEDDTGILSPFRFNGVETDPVSSDQL